MTLKDTLKTKNINSVEYLPTLIESIVAERYCKVFINNRHSQKRMPIFVDYTNRYNSWVQRWRIHLRTLKKRLPIGEFTQFLFDVYYILNNQDAENSNTLDDELVQEAVGLIFETNHIISDILGEE